MAFLDSGGLAHFWAKLRAALAGKQDTLSGKAGQIVGFNAAGKATAIAMPEHVTTQQVNNAIAEAVTGAIEGVY